MLLNKFNQQITTLSARLWGGGVADANIATTFTGDSGFGDISTNAAMACAKLAGRPPRELAQELAGELKDHKDIARVEVAGPGFVNIWLTDEALAQAAQSSLVPMKAPAKPKTVLVEYSDPNPFKPLHAGHLYTTLVGDVIARLVERRGDKVIRLNYSGDVGLHVGRCIWAIVQDLDGEHPERLKDAAGDDPARWMGECYAKGYAAYESDDTAKAQIIEYNRRVYDIHAHNDTTSALAKIYWQCRDWSYEYFKELYKQLQVVPFDRFIPESEVTPVALETVRTQEQAGVYEKSDGAVIFRGEPYGLHTRVFINSAGLPTYDAKDIGLLLIKWRDYHFDESIVITAHEQADYMAVMLKSVEQFEPEPAQRSKHLTHGTVKLAGGVKMSSRLGNVISALDILAAARQAGAATGHNPAEETVLAAVKYAFAKNRMSGDIAYDPQESIALEGNSGPYLQYAHARARSIAAKASEHAAEAGASFDPAERLMMSRLAQYGDVVQTASRELAAQVVCTYLYGLAQDFNRFYEANRVVGHERESERLTIVRLYADVLRDGLSILGISAPDHV